MTALAVDETGIAAALGSSGRVRSTSTFHFCVLDKYWLCSVGDILVMFMFGYVPPLFWDKELAVHSSEN